LGLVDLGSFKYYECTNHHGIEKQSFELAKLVIGWFLLGHGFIRPKGASTTETECLHKAFADEFGKHIKDAIQREPRLEWRKILEGTQSTMSEDERRENTYLSFIRNLALETF
jgi:hypothetical protein